MPELHAVGRAPLASHAQDAEIQLASHLNARGIPVEAPAQRLHLPLRDDGGEDVNL